MKNIEKIRIVLGVFIITIVIIDNYFYKSINILPTSYLIVIVGAYSIIFYISKIKK